MTALVANVRCSASQPEKAHDEAPASQPAKAVADAPPPAMPPPASPAPASPAGDAACGPRPEGGCVSGVAGGQCGDALRRHACEDGAWKCPDDTISTTLCACLGKPVSGKCTCTKTGWSCPGLTP